MRSNWWLAVLVVLILFPAAWAVGLNPFIEHLFFKVFHPGWVHIVSHILLFAALAILLTTRIRPGPARLPAVLAIILFVGSLQEGIQLLAAGRLPGSGELFDLVVDLAGGSLGYYCSTTIFPLMLPTPRSRQLEGDKE